MAVGVALLLLLGLAACADGAGNSASVGIGGTVSTFSSRTTR
jgi:hypothetical protein